MNNEARPPRRGLSPDLSPELADHTFRVEYAVFTEASPALAWKIFSNMELWPSFCELYEDIHWQGTPWTPGSRLNLAMRAPVNGVVKRIITVCTPPHCVAWIGHVHDYTMETWVSFEIFQGKTRISTWSELTGPGQLRDLLAFLERMIVNWFDRFKEECDRAAADYLENEIASTGD